MEWNGGNDEKGFGRKLKGEMKMGEIREKGGY